MSWAHMATQRLGSAISNRITDAANWCNTCSDWHDGGICPRKQVAMASNWRVKSSYPATTFGIPIPEASTRDSLGHLRKDV